MEKSVIISLILVFSFLSVNLIYAQASCTKCPDLNSDAIVNNNDAVLFYECISNENMACPDSYDLNEDGIISILSDVNCLNDNLGKSVSEIDVCEGLTCIPGNWGWLNNYQCGGAMRQRQQQRTTCSQGYEYQWVNYACSIGKVCSGSGNCVDDGGEIICTKCPDINSDGTVDNQDSVLFYECTSNENMDCPDSYDLNEDGIISILSDVSCLNDNLNKNINEISICESEPGCVPDWQCTGWGECINDVETRKCKDLNSCGIGTEKPAEEKRCSEEDSQDKPIVAIVDSSMYDDIKSELDQWTQDLIEIEGKEVEVKLFPPNLEDDLGYLSVNISISEQIREYITSKNNIESVIIIGNIFPAPIKINYQPYYGLPPRIELFDYYFISKHDYLPSLVENPTCEGECVSRFFNGGPSEIDFYNNSAITGRITPNSDNEIQEIKNYFNKIHEYRIGQLTFENDAAFYLPSLDELEFGLSEEKKQTVKNNIAGDFQKYFEEVSVINGDNSFFESLSGDNKVSFFYNGHGNHNSIQNNINSEDMVENNFLFSWFFSCSTGAFFRENYIAGRMLFKGNGLVVYASSPVDLDVKLDEACDPKGTECDFFLQTLLSSGTSFKEYFRLMRKFYSPHMYYNVLGDVTLRTPNNGANIQINSNVLNFGVVKVLESKELILNISNPSENILHAKIFIRGESQGNRFPVDPSVYEFSLNPGDIQELKITYLSDIVENINGIMTIVYNGEEAYIEIPIIGRSVDAENIIEPHLETGPIEIKESSEEEGIFCNGCLIEEKCYPYNYRKSNEYCSIEGEFVLQLKSESSCENNFECSSNVCVDEQCVKSGIFKKFLRWLKGLFS